MKKFDIIFDLKETIAFLPPTEQLNILSASMDYLKNKREPALQNVEYAVFMSWKGRFDEAILKEERTSLARAEAGRKSRRGKTKITKITNVNFVKNETENEVVEESPLMSLSPTPPISFNPKDNYNIILPHTRTREDRVSWESGREKSYKERFKAQGCGMTASRATGKNAEEIMKMLDAFCAKCQLGDIGHNDFSHFNNHFLQYIKNPENSISNGSNRAIDRKGSAGVSSVQDICEPF